MTSLAGGAGTSTLTEPLLVWVNEVVHQENLLGYIVHHRQMTKYR
jgi:hypothetical protein